MKEQPSRKRGIGQGRRMAPGQDVIVEHFRKAILGGKLRPGDRLPIRGEIHERFGVSRVTVQKALSFMARSGLTVARGKLGTFVADYPACLCRYGIAFPFRPTDHSWGGLYDALHRVAHRWGNAGRHQVVCYYGIQHEREGDYEALAADIAAQRLAGIFFASGPWFLTHSPVGALDGIPRAAVMAPKTAPPLGGYSTIGFDGDGLIGLGVRSLVEQGCRRPAILMHAAARPHTLPLVQRHLADAGLPPCDPIRCMGLALDVPEWAAHAVQIWMRLPAGERPDGLFVLDDNLLNAACGGLVEAGVRPGTDLPIVADSNFPLSNGSPFPVQRIGFDIALMLQLAIENLEACREGRPFEKNVRLPAVRESDISRTLPDAPGAQDPALSGHGRHPAHPLHGPEGNL